MDRRACTACHSSSNHKALLGSWILEGMGGEGKARGEVNSCLGV